MALVYKATNTVNGKAYIGVTRQNLLTRKREHKSRAIAGAKSVFGAAIRKYGWDAFVWEILEDNVSIDAIGEREQFLIKKHNTFCETGHGYNRTAGGGGTSGIIHTDVQRENIRRGIVSTLIKKYGFKRQIRLFHNRTGIPHTEETKKKISETHKALPLGITPAKLHFKEWPRIKSLRDAGVSFAKIGRMYNVRPETVFYFCKRRQERPA